ncbi:MAG: hypothetical protein J5888_01910 [Bacteroidaceae bacterium]|nr:hypothetical protein [Bacteroidaceae bacterium]
MKKMILMAVAFLMVGSSLMAQTKQGNKQPQKLTEEQISQKLAKRMACDLQLDEDKTTKFVPIYVDYRSELKKVWEKYSDHPKAKQEKTQGAEKQKPRQLTDEELEKMNANRFARSRATIDVEESYYKRFLTVLTQRQYEKMQQLEKMNLQRMKNERMRRMPNGKFNGKPNGQFNGKPTFPQRPNSGSDAKQRKAPVAENSATDIEPVEQQSRKSDRWISMNGVPVDGVPTTSGIYMNSKGERVYIK